MSKKQKLLRKRVEAEKLKIEAEAEELEAADSTVNVKMKYSVNFFNWAVSDSDESDVETTVILPLKNLKIQKLN